jgi:carbonic anhydrase
MISAQEALERLREGNRRFVMDVRRRDTLTGQTRRSELAAGQEPFAIVDRIRPSVEALLVAEFRDQADALVRKAVRANIRVSADHLRHGSEVLEQSIQKDGLLVVGAEYSLNTGVVDFFDGVPGAG